ncbi:MAG: methylated-DNA--[protein]-cysteine S-methyltransferase [Bacteroidales bacterium]|nr:methylated-DNA--[protein]-cysteine S-methyltransferase [Bacteroidales bacterium]
MLYASHYDSPLGGITMASDGEALVGLWFDGQRHFAETLSEKATEYPDLPIFAQTRRWLEIYFSGRKPDFTPNLRVQSSDFRKHVWQLLLEIPYGHTATYGEIARAIARENGLERMSAQAVGNAVGHNPIALIIPCHRVLGSDGSLTGYAAGTDKKAFLLDLEKSTLTKVLKQKLP